MPHIAFALLENGVIEVLDFQAGGRAHTPISLFLSC